MSVDEALLMTTCAPTLRFYSWSVPALSLGLHQPAADWPLRCARAGVQPVRRVSGGGAVLHAGDLTYAIVVPAGTPGVPQGLHACYAFVQELLVEGLRRAGLAAGPSLPERGADRAELCFARATGHEIALEARKLVGSAQRRTPRGWLQHGSLRLRDDGELYARLSGAALAPPPPSALALDPERLARTLAEVFAARLPGGLVPGTLSAGERALALERRMRRAREPLVAPTLSLSSSAGSADTAA